MNATTFIQNGTIIRLNQRSISKDCYLLRSSAKCSAKPEYLTPLLEAARTRLQPLGLHVPSLTWSKPVLTIYVSRDEGDATADDCVEASTELSDLLDCDDYFRENAYTLEVSTPGTSDSIDSVRAFMAFKGFPVRISKKEGFEAPRVLHGRLGDVTEASVFLNLKGRRVELQRESVADISLCTASEIEELSL